MTVPAPPGLCYGSAILFAWRRWIEGPSHTLRRKRVVAVWRLYCPYRSAWSALKDLESNRLRWASVTRSQ